MGVNYRCFFLLRSFKGNPPGAFYSFLFLPLNSQAAWVVSLSLKNDEFTTNNPQVGVNQQFIYSKRFLLRTGMLAWKVNRGIPEPLAHLPSPHPHRWEGRKHCFWTLHLTRKSPDLTFKLPGALVVAAGLKSIPALGRYLVPITNHPLQNPGCAWLTTPDLALLLWSYKPLKSPQVQCLFIYQ